MASLFNWLRGFRGTSASASSSDDLIARARALAAEGRDDEASDLFWKVKRSSHTPELLCEHAELLLGMGDWFGAVSRAKLARELDPENARAKRVQGEVLKLEAQESRKR